MLTGGVETGATNGNRGTNGAGLAEAVAVSMVKMSAAELIAVQVGATNESPTGPDEVAEWAALDYVAMAVEALALKVQ